MASERRSGRGAIVVGVGVVVVRDGRVPLGRRRDAKPSWSLPGGKLERLESLEDCARRELLEETGLYPRGNATTVSVTNLRTPALHTITFGVHFAACDGELCIREPDKFSAWDWFRVDRLPADLFPPTRAVLEQFLGGGTPSSLCAFSDSGPARWI